MGGRHPRRIPLAAVVVSLAVLTTPIHAQRDVNELRARAQQGDAAAQFNLGLSYATGTGAPQDSTEAARWFGRAADQGDAAAQQNLGAMYANGEGVPQDFVAAHMWLSLAVAQETRAVRASALQGRDVVAQQLTPEQIAEAERRARSGRRCPNNEDERCTRSQAPLAYGALERLL